MSATAPIDPIERWHAYMRAGDVALLDGMFADGAVFRSPAVHSPQEGKAITIKYLTAAFHVLGNPSFRYTGEWRFPGDGASDEGPPSPGRGNGRAIGGGVIRR